MLSYSFKRFIQTLITIVVASLIIFLIAEGLPGDVAQMVLGQFATEESLEALRKELGLNKPLWVRYGDWFRSIIRGNLGTSLSMPGVEIGPLLVRRARNSLVLAVGALIFIVPISLLLGVLAGLFHNQWLDRIISISTLTLIWGL